MSNETYPTGTTVRLVASTVEEVRRAAKTVQECLGDRFILTGAPRQGSRGDGLAAGVILVPKEPS